MRRTLPSSPRFAVLAAAAAGLALASMGCGNCGARSTPPPPPKTAVPAPPAKPSPSGPLGWVRVTHDSAPLYEEPEADDLNGFLFAGQLLERRISDFTGPAVMNVDLGGPEGPVHRDGELTPIRVSGDTEGWMFLPDIAPAPEGLPASRVAFCDALSAPPEPALPREACLGSGRFFLADAAPGAGRRLVAWASVSATASRLAALDLDALAKGQPAVRGALDASFIQTVRQVPLPGGKVLLMIQELSPGGARPGLWLDLVTLAPTGAIARGPQLPLAANEARGELVTNQQLRLRVEPVASGPTVRLEGAETVRHSRTGEVKSRRDVRRAIRWDAQGELRVEDERP